MNLPVISFIILEYRSVADVRKCIESINNSSTGLNYEIIVSSNSCYHNGELDHLKNAYRDTKLIINERNGGFAYGMNRGLRTARGEYLAILNSDVSISEGINELTDFMNKNPGVGAIGPKMIDSKGLIQDSFRNFVSVQSLIFRFLKRRFRPGPVMEKGLNPASIQSVDWLSGAFIMVRRSVFEITDGLDEGYFMYAEDMDWCARIRLAGFDVVYFPGTTITFSGSRSARRLGMFTFIFFKSHLRFWKKYGFFSGFPSGKRKKYVN